MTTSRATHALLQSLTWGMAEVMLEERDPRGYAGKTRLRFANCISALRKRSVLALERRGLVEPVPGDPRTFPASCRTTDEGEALIPEIRERADEIRERDEKRRAAARARRRRTNGRDTEAGA